MRTFDLDTPLMDLVSSTQRSAFRIRHSVEGILVTGGIGSGKSSGSGRMIALKYLQAGYGGLVLCAKPDEKEVWQAYCRMTGRESDLLIIEPKGKHHFNFLEYESATSAGISSTDNLVQVLKTVIRAGQEQSAGKSDDAFWETALDMLIANTIDLCRMAYGKVSVQALYDIVQSIPKSREDLQDGQESDEVKPFFKAFIAARRYVMDQIDAWHDKQPKHMHARWADDALYEADILDALPDARLLRVLDSFFNETLIDLSDKTRSIVDFSFSGFLFRLLREPLYSLFCHGRSTLTPEDCLEGRIILINLPVKVYEKSGRDGQILFKYCWQRAMEKRDITKNPRPVFLFADECQFFLHEHDQATQTTARSSRIATVYLTQNLHNLYAAMGGEKSEHKVKSFLGTLASKIFHANSDETTNDYSSKLIGDAYFVDESESTTVSQNFSQTRGRSLKLERVVRPEEFQRLRCGGPLHDCRVDAYFYRQGDLMNGRNYIKLTFNQNYQPDYTL
ncbi:type IV secretory system conjugative DNA transfer family protein [Spirosoma sordidisoli]|uniref:TraD/TraG TraM recognition site domain-containing protein n=1 Tax=Spirosoma sordidisoli TaxID=2502893 RepID=A0A4Q2UCV2_9BACT|nr:TraM recognition domain-containing protein [Spirosoma sordidisoli]RYC66973.1 hypothetical protein EQG79_26735 [Spirosoma sordidisoli]